MNIEDNAIDKSSFATKSWVDKSLGELLSSLCKDMIEAFNTRHNQG